MATLTGATYATGGSFFRLRHIAMERQEAIAQSQHDLRMPDLSIGSAHIGDGISEKAAWSDRTILVVISLMSVIAAAIWTAMAIFLWSALAS